MRAASFQSSSSWWQRRTHLERTLTTLVTMLLLAVIVLAVVLGLSQKFKKGTDEPAVATICLTHECIIAANEILETLDTTVDPCEDFYQYACGGFIKNNEIPDDKVSTSVTDDIEENMLIKLKDLITTDKTSFKLKSFTKLKDMYSSCVNLSRIEELGAKPMEQMLDRLGGWPVVEGDAWDEISFDWKETLYRFNEEGLGISPLFSLSVVEDMQNSSRRVISMDQPYLGMPDRAFLLKGVNDTLVQAYLTLMVDAATLLGAAKETAQVELLEVLHFEIALANFSLPLEEFRDHNKLYNKFDAVNLSTIAPQIEWQEFLENILHQNITEDEIVIVSSPSYIENAFELFQNTPKRVMANYLMWRAVMSTINLLGKQFRNLELQYTEKLTGQSKETSRWLFCMETVSMTMPFAVGAIYIRRYFHEEAKQSVVNMVNEIRNAFHSILTEIDWMDETTRNRALRKLKTMKEHIAYPDELLDDKKIDDFYAKLQVRDNEYFQNNIAAAKFSRDYYFSQLRKPVNKSDWVENGDVALINAFYDTSRNSIHFPAGILQGVFFEFQRPNYLNFGGIGGVIGHEITHGFDDEGRQYDLDGNLVDWWEEETDLRFRKKAQCFIDQYGEFIVPEIGIKVNGINTQGENIADNGGIKEAYNAYEQWEKKNGVEPLLPGLNFTQRQLFWLSSALNWCTKKRPKSLQVQVMTDVHSPSRFRVNGPVMNSPDFAEDFSCPHGSPMNPIKKCHMW